MMNNIVCRYHPHALLIEDSRAGDMICTECGLVVSERIVDVSEEWRTFADDTEGESKVRVGAAQNPLYDFTTLETTIIDTGRGGQLNPFGRQMLRVTKIKTPTVEKVLPQAHRNIIALGATMCLPKIVTDRAVLIFKHCQEVKCLHGRCEEEILASCIYAACRQENVALTNKEIAGFAHISVTALNKCFMKIKQSLTNSKVVQPTDVKNLTSRFCNRLQLQNKKLIRETAIHILTRADQVGNIQGRAPSSIAAAAIYMACVARGEKLNKQDIQVVCGVSQGTISTVYKLMLPYAGKLFPPGFEFQCPVDKLPRA